MDTIKKFYESSRNKIVWGFFSLPKHGADWAAQNEWRITVVIAVTFVFMLLGLLFGFLPTWAD